MDYYYKHLIRKLGAVISENDCDFILYPFGTRGGQAKLILNTMYGIDEKVIIDNILCNTYKRIESLEYLKHMDVKNCKVLITSDNENIYDEIREQLYSIFPKEQCIELLDPPLAIAERQGRPAVVEKMKAEGIAPIYHPQKTQSQFFLPFMYTDYIQRGILLSDDYFERCILDRVCRLHKNGIIGKQISEGNGIILDIGANIGNHTLYFCNEFNAKKVYCFEPIEQTFFILKENIKINHLEERVVLNHFGLGEQEEKASFYDYDLRNIGAATLRKDNNGNLKIKSLDNLGIKEKVSFIKIDVEGMELKVIKGGLKLIRENRPYMMVECFDENFPEVKEILAGIGYVVEEIAYREYICSPI